MYRTWDFSSEASTSPAAVGKHDHFGLLEVDGLEVKAPIF